MKKPVISLLCTALLLAACTGTKELRRRAAELCEYIPDHELLEQSKDYMTSDFYAVLDTMFNLPEHEAMDHEWLYYFVTGNGGTIADYEVVDVSLSDPTHAVAIINVRQMWEDGTNAEESDIEEHHLYMERVGRKWLMSDFDGHKADCIRHIALNRKEQAVRDAISEYLVNEIGMHYLHGELCLPTLMIVAESDDEELFTRVWGDFWVFWYNQEGDTLKTVSGGNHAGMMTLSKEAGALTVTSFDFVQDGAGFLPSAKQIFGEHFDVFQGMHSNQNIREAVRKEQMSDYVRRRGLAVRYYQDFGWPAQELL